MTSKIIQDVSRYQPQMDYAYLKAMGQDHIIIKGGSGNQTIDRKFEQHYAGARGAGMTVSPYFWVDPIYDPIKQAQFFLSVIGNKPIGFILLDFEQWWSDWQKWSEAVQGLIPWSQVPIIAPDRMLNHFKSVYEYMNARTDKNIIIYTAAWFLNAYCKQGYIYLADKYTHWADYSTLNTTKQYAQWSYLESITPQANKIPSVPLNYPTNKILMWQWSGDKFTVPGVWGDEYRQRLSYVDLNKWVNPVITIQQIYAGKSGNVTPPPEPQPEPQPEPLSTWQVWSTTGVKIRALPSSTSERIGTLLYKQIFQITSATNDGWGKLYGRDGYTALYYSTKISGSPAPVPINQTTKWKVTATAGLNVRAAPSTTADIIDGLLYGTVVEVTSVENGWAKLYGRKGYVSVTYLQQVI